MFDKMTFGRMTFVNIQLLRTFSKPAFGKMTINIRMFGRITLSRITFWSLTFGRTKA